LEILEEGLRRALWRWEDLRRVEGPSTLRLTSVSGPDLARLDVNDPGLERLVRARARALEQGAGETHALRVFLWSLAAVACLVSVALFGVPLLADVLAPLTPPPFERKLGQAVDNQLRAVVRADVCAQPKGRAALEKLVAEVSSKIPTSFPIAPAALDTSVANAVALPGGKIYIFRGLIDAAKTPDEVAGVIAHEIGHVANHDGMRRLIQSGGSSYLIGLLFGDIAGSGAVLMLAREIAGASYSREAETRADAAAISAMRDLGRSPVGLGELLSRLSPDDKESQVGNLLRSHPLSAERLDAVRRADGPASGPPLLNDEEWASLKAICKRGVASEPIVGGEPAKDPAAGDDDDDDGDDDAPAPAPNVSKSEKPVAAQPDAPQPPAIKPAVPQSASSKPDAAKPGAAKPSAAKPGAAKP
jgi:Zn-dependent protease with chaperone function